MFILGCCSLPWGSLSYRAMDVLFTPLRVSCLLERIFLGEGNHSWCIPLRIFVCLYSSLLLQSRVILPVVSSRLRQLWCSDAGGETFRLCYSKWFFKAFTTSSIKLQCRPLAVWLLLRVSCPKWQSSGNRKKLNCQGSTLLLCVAGLYHPRYWAPCLFVSQILLVQQVVWVEILYHLKALSALSLINIKLEKVF